MPSGRTVPGPDGATLRGMEPTTAPAPAPRSLAASLLVIAGLLYLGLGVVLGLLWAGGAQLGSLFPVGWLLPALLIASGALMTARRRADLVLAGWGVMAFLVFQLDLTLWLDASTLGVDDPGAFDGTILVGALGLVPLILRPAFRRS